MGGITWESHPTSLVESSHVGPGTRLWAFVHVSKGAEIGRDCNIGDHCYVEGGVKIGDEVVIKNGVSLWNGVTLENRVFVGPNVVFTNDPVPRSKVFHEAYQRTLVREGASLGANATLLCGITVGRYAVIGAGSVVTRSVPDFALAYGNPVRQHGWVCRCGSRLKPEAGSEDVARCGCGRSYRVSDGKVRELG